MTLDDARASWPEFGFAVYAFDPVGPVTLEIHAPTGEILTFVEATEADCLGRLWGREPEAVEEADDVFG